MSMGSHALRMNITLGEALLALGSVAVILLMEALMDALTEVLKVSWWLPAGFPGGGH